MLNAFNSKLKLRSSQFLHSILLIKGAVHFNRNEKLTLVLSCQKRKKSSETGLILAAFSKCMLVIGDQYFLVYVLTINPFTHIECEILPIFNHPQKCYKKHKMYEFTKTDLKIERKQKN